MANVFRYVGLTLGLSGVHHMILMVYDCIFNKIIYTHIISIILNHSVIQQSSKIYCLIFDVAKKRLPDDARTQYNTPTILSFLL